MSQDRSLTLERTFNAPIEAVWQAWTDPKQFVAWYGKPGNVLKETVELDVWPGGHWKSTTTFQGQEIMFSGVYRAVEKPTKLVFTIGEPDEPDFELVTVNLEDVYGKTKMKFKQAGHLPPKEYQTGLKDGWGGFFDHLEKHIEGL